MTKTLAELTVGNSSFSKKIPGLQIVHDTMTSGSLKECARLYYLEFVEGWVPKGENVHFKFGLLMHSARAIYDVAIVNKKTHDDAVRLAVRHCFEKSGEYRLIWRCEDCGAKIQHDQDIKSAAPVCLECNSEEVIVQNIWHPWISGDKRKNLKNLIRTIIWFLEHHKDSGEKTVVLADGKVAVELWFRFKLPLLNPEGDPYILTGHIDRLVDINKGEWIKDLKTSKSTINSYFFDKFSPDNQIYLYTAGGKVVFKKPILGVIIDGVQVAIDFTRMQSGIVQLTNAQIDEWLKDIQILLKQSESYAENGYWPMNDKACHNYGGCKFLGVCNKDPAIRGRYLETKFTRRVWNPLKERK